MSIIKTNWFWLFWAVVLICFASTLFIYWIVLIILWFSLFFFFRLTKLELKLNQIEEKIYFINILPYPIVESLVQWMKIKYIISYNWQWLNRIEHGLWAFSTVIMCLPLYTDIWAKLKWWQNLILIIGLICFLGNLNEFAEYFMRLPKGKIYYEMLGIYYNDTIYDMITNILGGFIAFLVLKWITTIKIISPK
jgi:hypothetical protein